MSEQELNLSEKPKTGGCACGGHDTVDLPLLDVQLIPHEIRHATIFGALAGIRPGRGLIIQATHNPVPLLRQLEEMQPGVYAVEYLQEGPEIWQIKFTLN
ncbi:DUF2249 domain-containing protein [Scrofimicrobium sp. R131]|uniref:DUF2249 domain-containing protein n=1 Tax=Scrofimicrobium appendicitidis TaxID=3079930 RepID=A0AAU7V8H3_9ACTO